MESGFRNILLIQLGDIGDVVLTTPTLCAISEAYPAARVSVLVRKPFGSLLAAEPGIHEVMESGKPQGSLFHRAGEYLAFARQLRRAGFDLAIDLRTGERGAILSFLSGAHVRVGRKRLVKPLWPNRLYTRLLDEPPYAPLPVHPGAGQSLRILHALGIDTADSTPRLHVDASSKARMLVLLAERGLVPSQFITLNPCSRWKYKEWGYANWAELAEGVWRKHQLATVLVGAPEDVSATRGIVQGRESYIVDLAGKTTLAEVTALLSCSRLHVGVDSAPPHIAAAVGTPTLTVFGPGSWKGWTVLDDLHQVVTSGMPCVPCNRPGCDGSGRSECLLTLGVAEVMQPVEALLLRIGEPAP